MKTTRMSVQLLTSILKEDEADFKAGLTGNDPTQVLQDLYNLQMRDHGVVNISYDKDGNILAIDPVSSN